jgi:hypothetical protein
MERAAEKDRSSHEKKLPATAKLAMLEDVMAVLRKCVTQLLYGVSGQADRQCSNVAGHRGFEVTRSRLNMVGTNSTIRYITS